MSIFKRRRDPDPLTRQYWHRMHVTEPLEATLLNTPPLGGWNRLPLVDVPFDYRDPTSDGVTFWLPVD